MAMARTHEPGHQQAGLGPTGLQTLGDQVTRLLSQLRRHGVRHWLERERDAFVQTLKITAGCVIAWWLAAEVVGADLPVLAPMGVLLTVTATAYSTVIRGVQQVIAVLVGFGAAFAFIRLFGVNAATLAVLIFAGLVLTRMLRLPPRNVQIPLTALLVLALGSGYGFARFVDTLIGAAVGMALNVFVLPPRYTDRAGKELADLADELALLIGDIARGVRGEWTYDQAHDWLRRAREVARGLRDTQETAEQAAESLRFTLHRPDTEARLRQITEAATCLDHACHQVRGIARGLADLAAGARGLPGADTRLPTAFPELLRVVSRAFDAFSRLQVGQGSARDLAGLRAALRESEQLQQALSSALRESPSPDLWQVHGALLDDCQRLLYEVDPDIGPHRAAIPARAVA